jgi:Uma2 family endonuclease
MSRLLSSDDVTGIQEYFDYDPLTDKVTVRVEQDVSAYLELAKKIRNDTDFTKREIKDSFWHYADLPDVVILEMRKKGIDVFNPHQTKEVLKEINQNYPYLKLTDKYHQ